MPDTTERLGIAVEVTPLDFDPAREGVRWKPLNQNGTAYVKGGGRLEAAIDTEIGHVVLRVTPGHPDRRAYAIDMRDIMAAVLDLHRERMAERRAA